jgi:hypothetical protein
MYSITLSNPFDAWVHLQIHAGSSASCDANVSIFDSMLASHAPHQLDTDANVVCWRRTANPAQEGSPLGQWTSFSPNDQNTPASIQL